MSYYIVAEAGTGTSDDPIKTRYWNGRKWTTFYADAKGWAREATAQKHARFNVYLTGWRTRVVNDTELAKTSPFPNSF